MGEAKRRKDLDPNFGKPGSFRSDQEFRLEVEPDYPYFIDVYLSEGSSGLICAIQEWLLETDQIHSNEPPFALTSRLNQVSMTVYSMAAKQVQSLASQSPKLAEFTLKIPMEPEDFGRYAPVQNNVALATEAMRLINSGYFNNAITFLINSDGDAVKTMRNHVVILYMGTNAALEIIDAACALVKLTPFNIVTYAGEQRDSITGLITKTFSPLANKIHNFRINNKGADKFPCLSLLSMIENKSTGASCEFRKHYTAQGGNQLVIPGYSAGNQGISFHYPPMDVLGKPSNIPVIRGFDDKGDQR